MALVLMFKLIPNKSALSVQNPWSTVQYPLSETHSETLLVKNTLNDIHYETLLVRNILSETYQKPFK